MTNDRRDQLNARWDEVNKRLAALHAEGKTNQDNPSDEEQELLGELDAIEGETGAAYLAEQRRERQRRQ